MKMNELKPFGWRNITFQLLPVCICLFRCTPPHLVTTMPEIMEDTPMLSQELSTLALFICKVCLNIISLEKNLFTRHFDL